MKEIFLAGRVLLGGYFLLSGAHHFTNATAMAEQVARHGIPLPTAAVLLAGLLLIVGGVTLLLGVAPRIGVAALALFLVPVTLTMHAFWHEEGMRRAIDLINFMKNFGLLGAVLMLVAVPEPWPYSVRVGWHLRRHARV
ncbi:MAG TPA: DoxX family protein [Polyangia bacterium]|nr:DoxX family protein [Polyangia bacterium]